MKVADVIKFGFWILLGLVALAVIGEILSIVTSGWFVIAAFAAWWFIFRNKKS